MAFGNRAYTSPLLAAVGVFIACDSANALVPACSRPAPGLQQGQGTVHAARDIFNDSSRQYPIEIFSDYAPQTVPTFCVLYEVENAGSSDITRFFWPLASLEMDVFPYQGAAKRQSVSKTIIVGRLAQAPALKDTFLYAFKSGFIKSEAYQAFILTDNDTRFALSKSTIPEDIKFPTQLAQMQEFHSEDLPLDKARDFPLIGAQFNGSGAEITATSSALWNGSSYTISISIGRNNSDLAANVRAPFSLALSKVASSYEFLALVGVMRNVPLPFDKDVFQISRTIKAEPAIKALYMIEQPIVFQRSDGKVCFTAPAYSPVPIPEKLLSCDLLR